MDMESVFFSVWPKISQAEGTASTNARRNGKEADGWNPVSKRKGGRKGSKEVGRTKALRAMEAVFIQQRRAWVTVISMWKMDYRIIGGGQ